MELSLIHILFKKTLNLLGSGSEDNISKESLKTEDITVAGVEDVYKRQALYRMRRGVMQMKINKHAVSKEAELETAIRDAYPKVYSYLYHRTLDAALSKDLTQETFYRFYRHLDQYEEQGKLLNFLYRIARHLVRCV